MNLLEQIGAGVEGIRALNPSRVIRGTLLSVATLTSGCAGVKPLNAPLKPGIFEDQLGELDRRVEGIFDERLLCLGQKAKEQGPAPDSFSPEDATAVRCMDPYFRPLVVCGVDHGNIVNCGFTPFGREQLNQIVK